MRCTVLARNCDVTIHCTRVAGRAFSNGQITRRNRVIGAVSPKIPSTTFSLLGAATTHAMEINSVTLISFGRAMPIHLELLSLVGYEDEGRDMVPAKELNARKRAMMPGLHSLRKTTGADFGYDAAAWRKFLIENGEEYGYMHPYAHVSVDKAVQAALSDPEVVATLKLLTTENLR